MHRSFLSRLLLTAVCLAALAGWAGVKIEVTATGPVWLEPRVAGVGAAGWQTPPEPAAP